MTMIWCAMGWVKVVSIFQSGNENERGGRPDDAAAMLQITKARGTCFAVELPQTTGILLCAHYFKCLNINTERMCCG